MVTSEVAIMNRRAIALAADSAVTVTSYENGKKIEKYYTGANKVFELSNTQAIGLMFFHNMNIMGTPWDVIIKAYRNQCKADLKELPDYGIDLFSYIEQHPHLFPNDKLKEHFRDTRLKSALTVVWLRIEGDARVQAVGEAGRDPIRQAVLDECVAKYAEKALPSHFSEQDRADIWAYCGQEFAEEVAKLLGVFDSALSANAIANLVIDALLKDYTDFLIDNFTGLVIAGFTKDDFFPGYVEFHCYGFLWTRLVVDEASKKFMQPFESGYVRPFASDRMASTFMWGAGDDVSMLAVSEVKKLISALASRLEEGGHTSAENVNNVAEPLVKEFYEKLFGHQTEMHYNPLSKAIGNLPVDEMASLAETLIMLESLKEKVTDPSRSVGGEIDVAVITKAEGLVWIKRKHYFPTELNLRFVERQRARFHKVGD